MKVKTLEAMIESKGSIYADSWSLILLSPRLYIIINFFNCIIYILIKLTIRKKLFYHILCARKVLKINSYIQKIS